jgi:tRNA pseudouridine38-40 synthase
MTVLLEIAYRGSAYHGWQVQTGTKLPTVQGELQKALEKLIGNEVSVTGCSRTDTGVHARQYFCTVNAEKINIPCAAIPYALGALLPEDIGILGASICEGDFHPRYSCKEKEYVYWFCDSPKRDPFMTDRAWWVMQELDEEKMDKAAKLVVGTHDFSAFCASGSSVEDKTRTVYSCGVERQGHIVKMTIRGNGFLYNMVRIVAGTLVDVSKGKLKVEDIPAIIASLDRKRAGQTAPPQGLYLERVIY